MKRTLSPGWLLFILTGLNLFNYLDRAVLPAVLTPLSEDLKLKGDPAGTIATAFMLGYFLTSPFFGYLGDRFSRKWLIATGIFVWSVGTVLTGYARTYEELLCYRVLVGLGEASYATISPGLISDAFTGPRRNNALTIFYVAIPVGAALGYSLGGVIAYHHSWREAFVWAGLPGLLLAVVLLPFQETARSQEAGGPQAGSKAKGSHILKLFTLRRYLLVVFGYTAYTFAVGGFAHWAPSFLQKVHGMPVDEAGKFFGKVLFVSGLVGTLLGGFLATAWQKRYRAGYAWTLALSVLGAVPMACLAFLARDRSLAMVGLALSMFMLFLPQGPINTLILETVPANIRSSAMAVSIFMIHLFGDMWSPKIVGRLWDHWQNMREALMILPAALLVAATLWVILAWQTARQPRAG